LIPIPSGSPVVIRSLDDAWRWYEAVKKLVGMMDRMGRRYWSEAVYMPMP
jgi:hypothetical protein